MTLLLGDASTAYSTADSNAAQGCSSFLFNASGTGTIDTLQFRTSGVANTGVTSLLMAVYSSQGATTSRAPNAQIGGTGTFSGVPAINSWITCGTGLSIPVVSGTDYWIVFVALGNTIHYTQAVASGGTMERDFGANTTTLTGLSNANWGANNALGPMGLQGLSSGGGGITNSDAPDGQLILAGTMAESQTLNDQLLRPASDIATTGWTNTPLFSKINDSSDGTFITATLA